MRFMVQATLLVTVIVNLRQGLVAYAAAENHVMLTDWLHVLYT